MSDLNQEKKHYRLVTQFKLWRARATHSIVCRQIDEFLHTAQYATVKNLTMREKLSAANFIWGQITK